MFNLIDMFNKNNIESKINLLGDSSVGKTSLIKRCVENNFNEIREVSTYSNVHIKEMVTIFSNQRLVIYEENFKESSGAIAVADTTNEKTLENLVDNWIPKYREIVGENSPIILAINKCDSKNKEVVYDTIINGYEEKFNGFLFTSARTGHNVEELFKRIGELSIYHAKANKKNIENILYKIEIDSPKDLLYAGWALSSEFNIMPFEIREEILKESGINKYSLDKEITEIEALHFVSSLSNWYNKKSYDEFENGLKMRGKFVKSSNIFLNLIHKYFENK